MFLNVWQPGEGGVKSKVGSRPVEHQLGLSYKICPYSKTVDFFWKHLFPQSARLCIKLSLWRKASWTVVPDRTWVFFSISSPYLPMNKFFEFKNSNKSLWNSWCVCVCGGGGLFGSKSFLLLPEYSDHQGWMDILPPPPSPVRAKADKCTGSLVPTTWTQAFFHTNGIW